MRHKRVERREIETVEGGRWGFGLGAELEGLDFAGDRGWNGKV